jgi:L-ascorbate metabolism protein UlaG (beta-lactamase superfamily)
MSITITLIGGPTALIELDGFRLLTDPTFDAPGAYQLPHVKLEKVTGPAFGVDKVGEIDAVLSATISILTISTIPAATSCKKRNAS